MNAPRKPPLPTEEPERFPLETEFQNVRDKVPPEQYARASAHTWVNPGAKKRPRYSLT